MIENVEEVEVGTGVEIEVGTGVEIEKIEITEITTEETKNTTSIVKNKHF